jgi:hypothetical protein
MSAAAVVMAGVKAAARIREAIDALAEEVRAFGVVPKVTVRVPARAAAAAFAARRFLPDVPRVRLRATGIYRDRDGEHLIMIFGASRPVGAPAAWYFDRQMDARMFILQQRGAGMGIAILTRFAGHAACFGCE